jgi:predicted lipoprotein with Yx(FWY)xxD motif
MFGNSTSRIAAFASAMTAAALLATACSSSSSSGTPAGGGAAGTPQSSAAARGTTSHLQTRSTSIGTVLVDRSGRTVYELVGDSPSKSTCTGGCLAVWPAVKQNGHQVVVNGHPAYTYVRDTAAGQTNGQNVTDHWGLWLALDPNGNPIHSSGAGGSTSPASPSSSSKAAPGGGGPAF